MNKTANLPENSPETSGFYYGYIILAACFFIMVIVFGSQLSFGVFFKPMLNEFGWTRAETAGPFALNMIVSGLLTIVSGRIYDRLGAKLVISTGAVIMGIGYLLMTTLTHLWQLYLYFGVLVAAGVSTMYVPLVSLLTRWFVKKRGLMTGIGIAGIGFGVGIIPALASHIIVSYSWRASILVIGIGSFSLIMLIAQFLKNPPSIQLSSGNNERQATTSSGLGFTLNESIKMQELWLIFAAWFFYGFFYEVGFVHIVAYATDLGLPAVLAATVLTIIGVVGGFGRIGLGLISDRLGNRNTVMLCFLISGAAYLGLSLSSTIWMLYVFAVIFGLVCGAGILLIPIIVEYFGYREMGAISGVIIFAHSMGGAISPPLSGAIFDITGSYEIAFIACGILGILSAVILRTLKPRKKREEE